jgi:hypothetical protein
VSRLAAVFLIIVLIAGTAVADQPDVDAAQPHVDAAMKHYEAEDLARALEELTRAYALVPRPDILFAMAKIHDERGDCGKAIVAYRTFLETRPGPNSTRIATDAIATCQKVLAASGEPVPAEPVPARVPEPRAAPAPEPLAPVTETRARAWYTDPLGDALVATGAGGLILGGVLYLSARTDIAKADQGGAGGVTLEQHTELADSADQKQLWAGVAAGAGTALIVAGVVRFMTGAHTETITVAPATGGATVEARWRF